MMKSKGWVRVSASAAHEGGNVPGRFDGMLVLRAMAGPGEGQQRKRGQLTVEGIPVLDRKNDVVVAADVKDGQGGRLERLQHGRRREGGALRRRTEIGRLPFPWHVHAQ